MSRSETARHLALKALALEWARDHGLPISATEVRLPRSHFRVDVAACARRGSLRTAVFECKQSRGDLLKDSAGLAAVARCVEATAARLRELEGMIGVHRPDCRRGEFLFPEFDSILPGQIEHETHRRLTLQLAQAQRRLTRGTKFAHMARYRCADALYLVVEDDIFAPAEIPAGWGLLIRNGRSLTVARPPVWLDAVADQRAALLESIALAATRQVHRLAGVPPLPFRDEGSTNRETS